MRVGIAKDRLCPEDENKIQCWVMCGEEFEMFKELVHFVYITAMVGILLGGPLVDSMGLHAGRLGRRCKAAFLQYSLDRLGGYLVSLTC